MHQKIRCVSESVKYGKSDPNIKVSQSFAVQFNNVTAQMFISDKYGFFTYFPQYIFQEFVIQYAIAMNITIEEVRKLPVYHIYKPFMEAFSYKYICLN